MNNKIRDLLLVCVSISLIFNNIPKPIQMNFIGGPVGNKLVFYPLLIGFMYTAYCQWKYKNILINLKPFVKYLSLYLGVVLLSLILGLFNYPYWNDVLAGPVNQIEKIPMVLKFFKSHGIEVDVKILTSLWIIARQLKGILLEAFWCFGGAYMFYCWYKDDWKRGLKVTSFGIIISAFIFVGYGIVDALFLAGDSYAKQILINVNPYLHPVKSDNGWWPPLLWYGQLRSIFSEPSHAGNLLACVIPIMFFGYLKHSKIVLLFFMGIISSLVILTKARTAYALLFGILFLSIVVCINDIKKHMKSILVMLLVISIGVSSGVYYMNLGKFLEDKTPKKTVVSSLVIKEKNTIEKKKLSNSSKLNKKNKSYSVEKVIDDNLLSLASSNKRSNGARYALIKTNLRIAAQHPVLGVGTGLGTAYMIDNYTETEKSNREVAMWIKNTKKYGVFASGKGLGSAMNEFITRLAQNGIVGLGVYLLPFVYVIYYLLKIGIKTNNIDANMLAVILISILVSGCNGSVNVIYSIWIFLGISFAMICDRNVMLKCDERA